MNWGLFIPELYLLLMAAVFFVLAMTTQPDPRRDYFIAILLALVGVAVCLVSVRLEGTLFYKVYRVDLFSQVFKVILATGLFLVICICSELNGIEARHHPEFYLLLTICTLAMMLLVSSVELLTIYVALELSSYSLYILVPLRRGYGVHIESGLKYFLIGAFASAVMLFGIAALYGVVHTTYVAEIVKVLPGAIARPAAIIGLVLTLCGFFFKLAVFPFHFWAPDAYQGAANQVTAYIATASKVAAVAILIRMVALSSGSCKYLVHVLVTLSIASMTVGNLVAIVQKDMKRLLAYSSISHAGYVLIGILSMSPGGYSGAIFYAAAYLMMTFTCFLVVVKVAYDGSDLKIAQLAGLHRRSPILAMALMISVFSLAGIPPTIGFTGKFLVFIAAMRKGYVILVLIAMMNVLISLYYYLLIVKAAYLLEPDDDMSLLPISVTTKFFTGALVTAIVVGGVFPHYLLELARAAARALL
ncbi:MAG: NADH-quinone oxidoreductase subunit N [Deltaproteobacteria bacterium]|nr:MAG: NADH-quinone oxidoreductase subunit N [Deltaproteobacteria bacterium]